MLQREFVAANQAAQLWQSTDNVLLAISGGVDSMVLMELFQTLPLSVRPMIGVAHVNHQLRPESSVEAIFLKTYCEERDIPYYETVWSLDEHPENNLEERAREERYQFFAKVYQQNKFDCLVTAHHGDDQAETILMKLTSGSQLQNLVGIRRVSQRLGMKIGRPLLGISKASLIEFAQEHDVSYFEDQTNHSDAYFRNRIRKQIIPKLKDENANFLKHIHSFVKQIGYANDIIEMSVNRLYPQIVKQQKDGSWELNLSAFTAQQDSLQYFVLVAFFQQTLIEADVVVNEEQLISTWELLKSDKAQGELHLAEGWVIKKRYQRGILQHKTTTIDEKRAPIEHHLMPGEYLYLTDHEWVAFEDQAKPISIPEELADWQRYDCVLAGAQSQLPLIIRHPQPGDRFIFNQAGNTKGVNRLFIDNKLSFEKRRTTWLVTDRQDLVFWIIPIRKSYLSITKETDKIHYRLIYLKNEQDLEGDSYVGERH